MNSLIKAVQTNTDFQELAETPLMLNVMAIAYHTGSPSTMPSFDSLDDHKRYLYDAVLERLLNRKQSINRRKLSGKQEDSYTPQEVRSWLIWLAKRMVEHDQTAFFIEQLRESWLDTPRQRQGYRLNSHILVGILIGIISACHITPIAGVA